MSTTPNLRYRITLSALLVATVIFANCPQYIAPCALAWLKYIYPAMPMLKHVLRSIGIHFRDLFYLFFDPDKLER